MRCIPCLAWTFIGLGLLLFPSLGDSALAKPAVLKQSEAELRRKQVEGVNYTLDVDLPEGDEAFHGLVRIDFTLHPQKQPLRVDFAKGTVEEVRVNGKAVKFEADEQMIRLDESLFQADAANQLEIRYSHAYSKDGTGLYWFRDPVDQKTYTFSQFEAYAANSFFPCFDQPDLKATYQLTVKAPKDWTVVTSVRESKVTPSGDKNQWEFPRSLKFSTYLLSLHAGPYRIWEDKSFRIPLRIMARQSMAQFMPVDQFFAATRHGFDYFDTYLGYAYPFVKYDQVVVPDFNAGAMENVAAVTFSERFLVRGTRTQADEQGLAATILHEMAHMWFGDLVTMQWWNDLWLNESFATYAASLGMAADPRFPQTWLSFNRSKSGAYYADQLVTTHPIVTPVPDTDTTNFDAITYGKGASFLKQLHFLIGEKDFQKGLQIYFKKHAFQNTQVQDFIGAMEVATGRSLQTFAKEWLETAGMNRLAVEYSCKQGKIEQIALKQSASAEHPTLREHKTQLALYRWKKGQFELIKTAAVGYQSATTVWKEGKGLSCPDLVFPNHGDYDYAKVILDPKSYKQASEHLEALKDPMQRTMVWAMAADMVTDGEISLKDFGRFVAQQLPKEKDYDVLRAIDARVSKDLLGYAQWIPEKAVKQEILGELLQVYEGRLKADLSPDSKKTLWNTYIEALRVAERSETLVQIWEGRVSYPGVKVAQDERWMLLQALSTLGHKEVLGWAEAEKKQDAASAGQRKFLAVKAAYPDYAQKMQMLEPIVKAEKKIPGAERWAVMNNLFPQNQKPLLKQYESTYRQEIDGVVSRAEPRVANSYVMSLLPVSCDASTLPLINELIGRPYPEQIHEGLLVARQNNERCQRVMSRLLSTTQG